MEEQTFKLINGTFQPEEARNILFNLVNTKINFHAMESFGISIRSSGDTSFHENRIKELTKVNHDLKVLIDRARQQNMEVVLTGDIKVTLLKKNNAR